MPSSSPKRRLILGAAALALVLLAVIVMVRQVLVGLAVFVVLKGLGASDISYRVVQATPWRVGVEDVGFQLGSQPYAVRRVTLVREHWWTPSLGKLQVEQLRVPVAVESLAARREGAPSGGRAVAGEPAATLPLEEISVDGQLVLQAAGQPDQALTVQLEAHPAGKSTWDGKAAVNGPGLAIRAEASYDLTNGNLAFTLPGMALDLQVWQGFLQRVVPLPAGDWELAGKFTGDARGRLAGGQLTATGRVRLREGRAARAQPAMVAEGIEADLEFTDIGRFTTKPGTLRIRELRTGQLVLRSLESEFTFAGADSIAVSRLSLLALGGRVSVEPFACTPSRAELGAVLLVDGLSVEELMALTKDLPAKATGRVSGRFPVRIDRAGLQLGTGWLGLKPGVYAEIQFNARGLLTGGMAPNSPSYALLQKVESGLLKLKISELRLDIRPPNAPPGRSAQLHLAGEPTDPTVKAPVTLDLNVNGPIEKLLNMGMDSRLSFGSGK